MSEWLYLVIKCQKGPKNAKKKPQIWLITHFLKKKLSWQIWNALAAKIWWKKNWCYYITLGVIFSHLVNLRGHFRGY